MKKPLAFPEWNRLPRCPANPPAQAWLPSLYRRSGFGLNEVIGIAAGIIIAVVIVIPGLQVFAANVLAQLTSWWNGMAADIFHS